MSRYEVDKVMREVVLMDEETFIGYMEDPLTFLEGFDLVPEEQEALVQVDYPRLYSQGAHPFLLQEFTLRNWPGDVPTLMREYGKAVEPYGYPDFST